jgi:hypothetical protein
MANTVQIINAMSAIVLDAVAKCDVFDCRALHTVELKVRGRVWGRACDAHVDEVKALTIQTSGPQGGGRWKCAPRFTVEDIRLANHVRVLQGLDLVGGK